MSTFGIPTLLVTFALVLNGWCSCFDPIIHCECHLSIYLSPVATSFLVSQGLITAAERPHPKNTQTHTTPWSSSSTKLQKIGSRRGNTNKRTPAGSVFSTSPHSHWCRAPNVLKTSNERSTMVEVWESVSLDKLPTGNTQAYGLIKKKKGKMKNEAPQ